MELEARDISGGDKQKIQNRVKSYQADQKQLEKELVSVILFLG